MNIQDYKPTATELNNIRMNKIQIIRTSCCGKIFAACREPECYTEKDWLKDLRKYALRGDSIETIDSGSKWEFETCDCKSKAESKTPTNQLSLI